MLMEYQATSRGEANYLIRHMMGEAGITSAPTDFLNRASWNRMYPPQMRVDTIVEEGDGENEDNGSVGDHNDRGCESDSPEKKRARSDAIGSQRNRQSTSPGIGGGNRTGGHTTLQSLDFMDEEEEAEAKFVDVLECLLPQLGIDPSKGQMHKGPHPDGPPTLIEFS